MTSGEYDEPHDAGEVLVAAVLNAHLEVWVNRLHAIGNQTSLDRKRAAEESAEIADRLLTMCIRAIDHCPPTDLQFSDFASAILTADWELNPRDEKYWIRKKPFKVVPGVRHRAQLAELEVPLGRFLGPAAGGNTFPVRPETRYDSMKTDPQELFLFLWENRAAFKLNEDAHTRVLSVRPAVHRARWLHSARNRRRVPPADYSLRARIGGLRHRPARRHAARHSRDSLWRIGPEARRGAGPPEPAAGGPLGGPALSNVAPPRRAPSLACIFAAERPGTVPCGIRIS